MKTTLRASCLFLLVLLLNSYQAQSQIVDTMSVFSTNMSRQIKNIVISPSRSSNAEIVKLPVLYLLHGYSGRYDSWLQLSRKSLLDACQRWNMIIVCPDGENSWYWDSPINPASQFETYVSKELIEYVDEHYNTIKCSKGRAITGLSMGGHGALWLAIRHSDVFGACGSMSGGVDIRPFPNNWEMEKLLGSYKENANRWNSHTVINQIDKIEPNSLRIIVDCGIGDFFFKVNEELHKQMIYKNISHDYITRPGSHTGEYWRNAIDYQLLFFSKFFSAN